MKSNYVIPRLDRGIQHKTREIELLILKICYIYAFFTGYRGQATR